MSDFTADELATLNSIEEGWGSSAKAQNPKAQKPQPASQAPISPQPLSPKKAKLDFTAKELAAVRALEEGKGSSKTSDPKAKDPKVPKPQVSQAPVQQPKLEFTENELAEARALEEGRGTSAGMTLDEEREIRLLEDGLLD